MIERLLSSISLRYQIALIVVLGLAVDLQNTRRHEQGLPGAPRRR